MPSPHRLLGGGPHASHRRTHSPVSPARLSDRATVQRAAAALGRPGLGHDEVLFALAACFGGREPERIADLLDDAARALFDAPRTSDGRAARLTSTLMTDLGLRPERYDFRSLVPDLALDARRVHPLLIAVIGHELVRRAGWTSRVCSCRHGGWWVALRDGPDAVLVGCGPPDSGLDAAGLASCCAHVSGTGLLEELAARAPRTWQADIAQLLGGLQHGRRDTGGAS